MKNTMVRSLSLLGLSLAITLSAVAQDAPKVKTSDKENKYKSEDLKVKDKKDEHKYKSDNLKVKHKEEQTKYKADDMKIKEDDEERKVKAKVMPMQPTKTVKTEIKTGETDIMTKQHIDRVVVLPPVTEQAPAQTVAVPKPAAPVKKVVARKSAQAKRPTARNTNTKYVYRTKIVRDTVFVPSPPEKIVITEKEIVRDTVSITRVDTVIRMETQNTYTGYSVPRGDFKKVKLKKDDDGDVWMKRKDENGKMKTEKLEKE